MKKEIDDSLLIELINKRLTGNEISKHLGISRRTLYNRLNLLNLKLNMDPTFNINAFDNIDNEEKSYWIGFLFSDGYVSADKNVVELSLKGSDINHLIKFANFLEDQRNIENSIKISPIILNNKQFFRCRYQVCNKHFHDRLCEIGCTPRKSLTLKFPDLNIFSRKELVIDFLRGYIDGDGCLSKTTSGRLRIEVLGTEEFLTKVKELFPEFGKIMVDKRNSNVKRIICENNKADELSIRVYDMYTGDEMNRYQLVNFEIYKKKINRPYQMYFRILDITKPINN